jgi:hypothetical protein
MSLTKKQRAEVHAMFGGKCAYCGHDLGKRWHADHIAPVQRKTKYVRDANGNLIVKNGRLQQKFVGFWSPENDREDNYYPACAPCNIDKSCLDLESWRRILEDKINIALRASSPLRHALRFGMLQITEKPVVFYFESLGKAGNQ